MQASPNIHRVNYTIPGLVSRFRGKVLFTLFLVVTESLLDLLFPLFIGLAINGLLQQNYNGILYLAGLGILTLMVGSARRFFDTRAYSDIYITISEAMVLTEQQKESSISKISGRVSLLTEFIEFLENSMPMIVSSIIGILGVLIIIFTLNIAVFWACIGLLLLIIVIYLLSGKWNFRFNEKFNDEIENQVEALSTQDSGIIRKHFNMITHWNIKLSDLETWNYAVIWLGTIGVLVYAPVVVIGSGIENYGFVFSVLMYVFQYVESLISLPYFIQQIIRLQEISGRLQE